MDEDSREDKFVREIEERDGRRRYASFEEVKADLTRRCLREPDPEPEFMTRTEAITAIRMHMECDLHRARFWAPYIPSRDVYGRKWFRRGTCGISG